jgi:hypothetical protein
MNEPTPNSGAFIAKLGAWLQLAQVIGFAGTVNGMRQAFTALNSKAPANPPILTSAVREILWTLSAGLAVSLVGILLVLIAITVCRYRAVWMFWFLCLYGGLMILTYFFPFGLFFLIYGLVKKDEFLRKPAPELLA